MSRDKRLTLNVIRQIRVLLPIVAVVIFIATVGSVFAQTPIPPPSNHLASALKLLREHRAKEAVDAFKEVTDKNRADGEGWYYLGVAYLQTGDFKKASNAFQSAIKLQPDVGGRAHAGYAYALLRRNKLKEAREEAQQALSVEPKNTDALYTLGIIGLRTGKRDEALKYADALVAIKPDMAEAYLMKSQALVPFNGEAIITKPGELKGDRLARYQAAAAALEQYLKLAIDRQEAQIWRDQLDSLKFYMADKSDVYRSSEVTTKIRVLSKPEPAYTEKARQEQIVGRVTLRCVFAADGTVKHILVLESLPHGLTDASIRAAKRIKFVPATLNGQPVSMFMQLEYNFALY